ncbi:MAG TPA: cytochrome c biogenesis protein CcdA [Solirubrobacteraceae bacterium]|nr:cytochrome c biogenesis protein CcdA [Solirubrobacteraceae bacterium]
MTKVGIPIAFLAGIISFASPCCLPLVPGYVSYMVSTSPDRSPASRRVAFFHSLAFVAGFSVVFIAIWASVGLIGYLFHDYVGLLRQLGGAVLIFMGLHVAGVINVSALYREKRLPMGPAAGTPDHSVGDASSVSSYGRSALLGVVFSAGWTPCIGPILGGIIGLASVSASVAHGAVLLLVYAIGLGIPFILVALGATAVSDRLGWVRRHNTAVSIVTGAMLVGIGFLMITNTFGRLSGSLPLIEI